MNPMDLIESDGAFCIACGLSLIDDRAVAAGVCDLCKFEAEHIMQQVMGGAPL